MRTSGQAISKVGTIIARVYKNLISIGLQVRRRSYGGDYGLGWGEYELTLEGFRRNVLSYKVSTANNYKSKGPNILLF